MPEIVSIFQSPLWKKIVVPLTEGISIVKLYAPLQTFSSYFVYFCLVESFVTNIGHSRILGSLSKDVNRKWAFLPF